MHTYEWNGLFHYSASVLWMSHPSGSSLDKTMPSRGIALQRQRDLYSIHRNTAMPAGYFIHIKHSIWQILFFQFYFGGTSFCLLFWCVFLFICAFVSAKRKQTCCPPLSFARLERKIFRGTAVRNLQHSESGSCLWMSSSRSFAFAARSWGHFIWMCAFCCRGDNDELLFLRRFLSFSVFFFLTHIDVTPHSYFFPFFLRKVHQDEFALWFCESACWLWNKCRIFFS